MAIAGRDGALTGIRFDIQSTTSDFPVTSSNVLTNLPGLTIEVAPGHIYCITVVIFIKSGATSGGMQAALIGSSTLTTTRVIYDGFAMDTGGTPVHGYTLATSLGTAVAASSTASDTSTIRINGTIAVANGGQLTVQVAQNSINGTATVFGAGSYITVRSR